MDKVAFGVGEVEWLDSSICLGNQGYLRFCSVPIYAKADSGLLAYFYFCFMVLRAFLLVLCRCALAEGAFFINSLPVNVLFCFTLEMSSGSESLV